MRWKKLSIIGAVIGLGIASAFGHVRSTAPPDVVAAKQTTQPIELVIVILVANSHTTANLPDLATIIPAAEAPISALPTMDFTALKTHTIIDIDVATAITKGDCFGAELATATALAVTFAT